ncbi:MAG: hypothetical protein WBP26_04590 [Candidatus Saccharimonadales bacterium]
MKLISKTYIQDKMVLLLGSINIFLVFIWTLVISLRLAANRGAESYFVEYRPVIGSIAQYKQGGVLDVLSFVAFMWVVLVFVILLSSQAYRMKRHLALMVLVFGILVSLCTMIVSNALLVLH